MTTSIFVHCPVQGGHRVKVETVTRVDANQMTDEWIVTQTYYVEPGCMAQTYCTDTRKVVVTEAPLAESAT